MKKATTTATTTTNIHSAVEAKIVVSSDSGYFRGDIILKIQDAYLQYI